ncbi:hypothetical protein AMRN_1510 [Malaciobacter marinus]|uniref:Uncharacterized protein n=1 Tax=Malaciobacter marinus TaxID=505249 RepID=A0A347TKW7_9BACT|nr:hypothetical protein [Malaciobacter marinus]AXX87245.1 hypothetical protein AMRN_1510 [Malaciobacter marinus]PHO12667.1 hypothetical protein CPG38_06225 [Malaciobacter marinus]PHO14906.1 hypothetical protein CPH92_09995 [Malaciobacter marinus]
MIFKVFFTIFFTIFLGFCFIFYFDFSYNKEDKYNKLNSMVSLTNSFKISFSNAYSEDNSQLQNKPYLFHKSTNHMDFIYVK